LSARNRLLLAGAFLALLILGATGASVAMMYNAAFRQQREQLAGTLRSQGALIAAMAQFDRSHSPDFPSPEADIPAGGPAATLSQIADAFGQQPGFGRTGELVLGGRIGGRPAILIHQHAHGPAHTHPLDRHPVGDGLGEPMQRALAGDTGTMVGRDYDGRRVLAAYRFLPGPGWGLVAKQDLSAIRAPYLRAGLLTGGLGLGFVVLGGFLFQAAMGPVVNRLRRSEARWARLFESAGEGIVAADGEGRILLANPEARRIFGLDPGQELAGTSVFDHLPEAAREGFRERLHDRNRGRSDHYEVTLPLGGVERTLDIHGTPLPDSQGGTLALIDDITGQKRAEDEVERQRELLQQVLNTLPVGVWVVDADGQFILHNPAGEQIWQGAQYQGGQAAYAEYRGWWADSGEEIAPEEWAVARAVNHGETSLNEVIDIQCFDGSLKTILNASVPMRDADGAITGAIIVNEDITQRRAMERLLQRNQELLELVLDNLPVGVAVTDEHGRFILTNDADTAIWGLSRVGLDAGAVGASAVRDGESAAIAEGDWPIQRAMSRRETVLEDTLEVTLAGGADSRVLAISAAPILGRDGSLWGAAEIIQDITARRREEAERRTLSDALRQTADAVFIMDPSGRIEYANPAFEQVTGYPLAEARGRRPEELLDAGRRDAEYYAGMWATVGGGEVFRDVVLNRARDGSLFHWEKTLSPLAGPDGSVVKVVGTATDLTEQQQLQDQLYNASRFDPLTELPNRALLLERLAASLTRAHWSGRVTALVLLDVDNFTLINDTLGHDVGDQLLRDLGQRLQAGVREGDLVARTGDDGFGVLLEEVAGGEDVPGVVQALWSTLTRPFEVAGQTMPVAVTVGVSVAPDDAGEAHALFRNADTALAEAKHAGRTGVNFYAEEMGGRARRQLSLESGLRQALEREELSLHFQPQIRLADGRLRGLEALLRWEHPEWGPVSPAEFIPVAEQAGLIGPIGDWVVERALRQRSEWVAAGLEPGLLSINLSPVQMRDMGLAERFARAIDELGLRPADLELEVTETALMQGLDTGANLLSQLSELGVNLAVDDFGTGYSSLAYLSHLPLDSLKIDRSFVSRLEDQRENASIVLSVLSLAHSLGLEVVAEGVETADQLAFLQRSGCDTVQGFYFARPLPPGELDGLLERATWL